MRAVDERIAITSLGGIAHFRQTVVADEVVGWNPAGSAVAGVAGLYLELSKAPGNRLLDRRRHDPGQRWRAFRQFPHEEVEHARARFRVNLDTPGAIPYPPGDFELTGEAGHEGAEADPLDASFDRDETGEQLTHGGGRGASGQGGG